MMNLISRIIKNILFALRNSNDDKSFSEGMYLDKPKDSEYQADTVNVIWAVEPSYRRKIPNSVEILKH